MIVWTGTPELKAVIFLINLLEKEKHEQPIFLNNKLQFQTNGLIFTFMDFLALAVLKDRIQLIQQRSKRIRVELRLKISDQYQHNQRRIPKQVNE